MKYNQNTFVPPYLLAVETPFGLELREFNPETDVLWPELVEQFQFSGIKIPFLFTAPHYHVEALFYLVCKKFKCPASVGTVYNLPLSREILRLIKPDLIVIQSDLVEILLEDLSHHQIPFSFSAIFTCSYRRDPALEDALQKKYPLLSFIFSNHPLL